MLSDSQIKAATWNRCGHGRSYNDTNLIVSASLDSTGSFQILLRQLWQLIQKKWTYLESFDLYFYIASE